MSKLRISLAAALASLASSAAYAGDIETQEQRHWPSISLGQGIDGTLSTDDIKRDDGTYADGFFYDAKAGETVVVTLSSPDFDSWLVVDDPGSPLMEIDDDNGGGTDSKLTFTFPHAGRYLILANTVATDKTGRYSLAVNAASPAEAAWSVRANAMFSQVDEQVGKKGLKRAWFERTGRLAPGAEERVPYNGDKDHAWTIVGQCDDNCSDLDLQLLDSSGKVVSSDVLKDDYPVVNAAAGSGGAFTLVIKMVTCKTGACYYRVRDYTKS